jgi:hypothetical protein
MMAVPVKALAGTKPAFEPGVPQPLFEAHLVALGYTVVFEYDVTTDGERFLIDTTGTSGGGAVSAPLLNAVVNWNTELKR